MRYFPLFYDLKDARSVVVGGGEEALRKVRLLAKTEAMIELVAPALVPELAQHPRVTWVAKSFTPALLDGAKLVISAEPALNEEVSAAARARNIPVNAVDDAALSTFLVPAIVDRDPVIVAIGTEGAAPVLAQYLRARIDALLPTTLGRLTAKAASLRHVVADRLSPGKARRSFWHDFFFGTLGETHHAGDAVAFELALGDALFAGTKPAQGRLTLIIPPRDVEDLSIKAQRRLMEADVLIPLSHLNDPLLEMARRDAVRLTSLDAIALPIVDGQNVVVIARQATLALKDIKAQGLKAEVLDFSTPAVTHLSLVKEAA